MDKEIKSGTTTVGLIIKDGLIIAAESQASMGHLAYDEETKKVFQITNNLGMAIAGSVGDAQTIIRFLKSRAKLFEIEREGKMTPKALATFLCNVLNANRYYPFFVQFIVGGINKGPELYDIDPTGGMLERRKYAVNGSGTELALAVLDQTFKPGLDEEPGIKTAVRAISEARRRDSFSGGFAINILVITSAGVKEKRIEDIGKFLKA